MNSPFKMALMAIMVTNKGRVVTAVGSIMTAIIVGLLARAGTAMSAEATAITASIITAVTGALIEAWAISNNTAGIKKIQEMLNDSVPEEVKRDGVVGTETINAAKKAI